LHVERGFRADESTVTVFGAEGPHNINDHDSVTAKGILTTAAGTMATAGNNNLISLGGEPILIMGPEHAATVAGDGFSKADVKEFIAEHAWLPRYMLSEENLERRREMRSTFGEYADSELVPLVSKSEEVMVMVVGGAGKHSCFVPTFGSTNSVTRKIEV